MHFYVRVGSWTQRVSNVDVHRRRRITIDDVKCFASVPPRHDARPCLWSVAITTRLQVMPCIASRFLPGQATSDTICTAIYECILARRTNIIRVTPPRRYSAEDLRRRDLVTMSRVRDGWRSHPSVTLRNIRT